ncbi:hypothetical protein [Leifsonia sp. 21MFCrub1.1]|uniref:hypothetical protein n=1 Tax=Leifsonia sp. 21MFCrub1.1 TaxID=1798223 RepID=UPI0008928185|nr:hypothetical protein [Leifsonia sp. 21MFCrub1.1]SEA98159.1 hypothetical protein SAMN04515680_2455 [Leifsonia sp. 21MFCrub1.1]
MNRWKAVTLAAGAAASLLALAGCAAGAGDAPTPTVTVTSTVTATPAPATASPDDPLDALTAWTACAVLAQEVYGTQAPDAVMRPYDPAHPPTKRDDGTWDAVVAYPIQPPVEGAGSVIVDCQIGGTLGSPKLIHWVAKDI